PGTVRGTVPGEFASDPAVRPGQGHPSAGGAQRSERHPGHMTAPRKNAVIPATENLPTYSHDQKSGIFLISSNLRTNNSKITDKPHLIRDNVSIMIWNFVKMHGAGNDFVVLDGVRQNIDLTPERARALADRHFG